MRIHIRQIPFSLSEFHVRFTNYLLARTRHRLTEGVPAPFPEHEIFRVLAERIECGEPIEIYDDAPPDAAIKTLPELMTQAEIEAPAVQRSAWTRIIEILA